MSKGEGEMSSLTDRKNVFKYSASSKSVKADPSFSIVKCYDLFRLPDKLFTNLHHFLQSSFLRCLTLSS
jgi:hypothetical protein